MAAQLKAGGELEIELKDYTIRIHPAASNPTFQELLDGITPENCYPATDWGRPAGARTFAGCIQLQDRVIDSVSNRKPAQGSMLSPITGRAWTGVSTKPPSSVALGRKF